MSTKYFDRWSNYSDFAAAWTEGEWNYDTSTRKEAPVPEGLPADDDVLFASYGGGNWEGEARSWFRRDGKIYEASGSHCSCRGLEGQWAPAEVSVAYLQNLAAEIEKGESWGPLCDHSDEARRAFVEMVRGLS